MRRKGLLVNQLHYWN